MDSLKWPSYSPDINPMENIWAWLKARMNLDMLAVMSSLRNSIRSHWRELAPEMILPYPDDMGEDLDQ